ncbi:hypothetical protein PMIN01_08309 [Paraphaeosphaeria minitans]|uniref:Uncharacterized protein n=1 Tax=Paraphaeosphaeria minitans TaxID=565426 RepID=A0A9P6GEW2_9PLEO|nr:hypothetical protein PMIN01_08309 [Paraphaeosphaeria minitans]
MLPRALGVPTSPNTRDPFNITAPVASASLTPTHNPPSPASNTTSKPGDTEDGTERCGANDGGGRRTVGRGDV